MSQKTFQLDVTYEACESNDMAIVDSDYDGTDKMPEYIKQDLKDNMEFIDKEVEDFANMLDLKTFNH